nr:hypothetical protein SYMBAF_90023 [Serratia symbiotica]
MCHMTPKYTICQTYPAKHNEMQLSAHGCLAFAILEILIILRVACALAFLAHPSH